MANSERAHLKGTDRSTDPASPTNRLREARKQLILSRGNLGDSADEAEARDLVGDAVDTVEDALELIEQAGDGDV